MGSVFRINFYIFGYSKMKKNRFREFESHQCFKMEKKIIEQCMADNFADFWPNFLLPEIHRFQRLTLAAGSPVDAHILQVIACSQLLLLTFDRDKADENFNAVEALWNKRESISC